MRAAAGAAAAGAAIGAGAGALWAFAYALPLPPLAALVALHGLAGAALGMLAGSLLAGRVGALLGAAVVLGCLVGLPALRSGRPQALTPLAPRSLAAVQVANPTASRVAVIGLDGADWQVIDPLLAAGELPHLAALLGRGRGWVLRSIEPSSSPVVWSSIFSGKRPEDHGLEDWESSRADNRRAAMLWELANAAGLSAVVVNVPGSWPPTAIEGALVSGFPMPSPLLPATAETGFQNLGTLVDPEGGEVEIVLGRAAARSRLGLRHPAIERAVERRWLATRPVAARLAAGSLEPGSWSPWRRDPGAEAALVYRARRLADARLWVTPAFQDPRLPSLAFTSAPEIGTLLDEGAPYVVEGAGWRLAEQPALRAVLIEHLEEIEARHLRAAETLLDAVPDWRVLAHVITLPDRVSHAFWRFHDPAAYPPVDPAEGRAHRERVRDAYRVADRHLGALVARIDDGRTLVLVASDHGFQSTPPEWGGHRDAGILLAAGPGVSPSGARGERSIFDVTPLALAALGLPVADDMAGDVPPELAAAVPRRIASYERDGASDVPRVTIDETTNEQLRSLGYVE